MANAFSFIVVVLMAVVALVIAVLLVAATVLVIGLIADCFKDLKKLG